MVQVRAKKDISWDSLLRRFTGWYVPEGTLGTLVFDMPKYDRRYLVRFGSLFTWANDDEVEVLK